MLCTIGLEHNIKIMIKDILPDIEFEDINFCAGYDNSTKGIYVFSENDKCHYIFIDIYNSFRLPKQYLRKWLKMQILHQSQHHAQHKSRFTAPKPNGYNVGTADV